LLHTGRRLRHSNRKYFSIGQIACHEVYSLPPGVIKDEKGEGLPGVSTLIKSSQAGVITDVSGNFSISVPNASSVLVVSYVGFLAQKITVGNR